MNPAIHNRLIGLGHDAGTPLTVSLVPPDTSPPTTTRPVQVVVSRILRLLPGKRLVGVASWRGQEVIVKLFYHKNRWSRHLQRETAGFALAESSGLPVPEMLASGNIAGQRGGYLISEYLANGTGLDTLVESHDADLDISVSRALRLIARCHKQGLWQQDIHLGNFMAVKDTMYLLDSAEFKSETPGSLLSESLRLTNLALFFAQFSVYRDARVGQLMDAYNQQLAESEMIDDFNNLQVLIRQSRERRLDKYQSKLFRATSAFHKEQSAGRRMLCNRKIMTDEFYRFIEDPDAVLERGTIFKAGNTTTVGLVSVDGRDYVLKRYNIKNRSHAMRRMLRPSRASKSWQSGLVLEMLGVTTARPLMMLERRAWWVIRRESYILYELVPGATVPEILQSETLTAETRDRIFESFRQFFQVMRRYNISHGDLKASNFIFANDELVLLDLDATTRHALKATFRRAFRKDLERFVKNFSSDSGLNCMEGQALSLVKSFSE